MRQGVGQKMKYYLEYLRPDGWWLLISYDDDQEAHDQMATQLENYPNASYRVRASDISADDLAAEDER